MRFFLTKAAHAGVGGARAGNPEEGWEADITVEERRRRGTTSSAGAAYVLEPVFGAHKMVNRG
jgi:hypothetical protein